MIDRAFLLFFFLKVIFSVFILRLRSFRSLISLIGRKKVGVIQSQKQIKRRAKRGSKNKRESKSKIKVG